MDEVNLGPFNTLLDIEGVNGPEDIFGNVNGSFDGDNPFTMGSSSNIQDLPYNGNPFAGGA
ncbi:hypothetical protein [Scytonema sp. NUACC26]|uniref:hypothetical protein n=1 Tax=Scytonema sp. NUACC26 TaxID=3140176 RepID=UPI0034DBBF4E